MFKLPHYLLCCLIIVFSFGCVATPNVDNEGRRTNESSYKSSYTLENRLQLANIAYDEGRLVDAERLFLNIVSEHRSLTDAWFKLGNVYYRSGRYKAAINAYETILQTDSTYERAWYNLALTRISQSMETLDVALLNLPKDSPLHLRTLNLKNRIKGQMSTKQVSKSNISEHDGEFNLHSSALNENSSLGEKTIDTLDRGSKNPAQDNISEVPNPEEPSSDE